MGLMKEASGKKLTRSFTSGEEWAKFQCRRPPFHGDDVIWDCNGRADGILTANVGIGVFALTESWIMGCKQPRDFTWAAFHVQKVWTVRQLGRAYRDRDARMTDSSPNLNNGRRRA